MREWQGSERNGGIADRGKSRILPKKGCMGYSDMLEWEPQLGVPGRYNEDPPKSRIAKDLRRIVCPCLHA
jgi:hypothetical protein